MASKVEGRCSLAPGTPPFLGTGSTAALGPDHPGCIRKGYLKKVSPDDPHFVASCLRGLASDLSLGTQHSLLMGSLGLAGAIVWKYDHLFL